MEIDIIGRISLYDMMMYFFIYSFLGWVLEVVFATLKTGKFINRGFLNGPVCPIYGVGMAICVLLLNTLEERWYLLFIVGMILASFLEFITGFVLEKIFKTKWWDYSKEPFNLKGYICLKFSLLWGIAVLLVFKTIVPITDFIIKLLPFKYIGLILLIIMWSAFITDFICTIFELKNLNVRLKEIEAIGEKMRSRSNKLGEKIFEATTSLSERIEDTNNKIKNSRLGKAFPYIHNKNEEIKNKIDELINKKNK